MSKLKDYMNSKIQKIKKKREEIEEEDFLDLQGTEEEENTSHPLAVKEVWIPFRRSSGLGGFTAGILKHRTLLRNRKIILAAIILVLLCSGLLYLNFYVCSSYTILKSAERSDVNGTQYELFGKNLLKYSPDGVICMDPEGGTLWSSTYSMQSPVIDICGTTAVVAEQKGTQIYIFNSEGLMGQFQTLLPIEKVRVAEQGVVAAVLSDRDTTWINFYNSDGNIIAENRTSIGESGYPLDIALSPDGLKLMVSYLRAIEGVMDAQVSFYSFSSVGKAEINNLVNSVTYKNNVVAQVGFIDTNTSFALRSDGFTLFEGKQIPEEKANIEFEEEILSTFTSQEYLGFVFHSDDSKYKYRMELYNGNGRRLAKEYFDIPYRQISIEEGNIILFNDSEMVVYNTGGRKKFCGKYKKPIQDVISVKGFRKYMVLTQDSTEWIRLK